MTQAELNERIKKHKRWLLVKKGGEQLLLGDKDDVKGLDFSYQDLRFAVFNKTDLSFAMFYKANLEKACLDDAIFNHTNFDGAAILYDPVLILRLAEDIKKSEEEENQR